MISQEKLKEKISYFTRPIHKFDDEEYQTKGKYVSLFILGIIVINLVESFIDSPLKYGIPDFISKPAFQMPFLASTILFILYIISRTQYWSYITLLFYLFVLILNLLLFNMVKSDSLSLFVIIGFFDSFLLIYLSYFVKQTKLLIIGTGIILLSFLYVPFFVQDFPFNTFIMIISFISMIAFASVAFQYSNEKKNTQINEIVSKLQIETDRANDANKAKSIFLSRISHEIRNPLHVIKGYSSILLEEKTYSEKFVQSIDSSTENLLKLIDDFLDLTLIEQGKITIEKQPEDIKRKLEEIFNFFQIQFEKKGLEYKLVIDKSVPDVAIVDIKRINQILMNLIQNAIRYTIKGYVKVKLTVIKRNESSCILVYDVIDSGIGIKEENKKRLFKSFSRLTSEQMNTTKGVGLGLVIVNKFVEAMNGKINIISEIGKGSTFTLEIPAQLLTENKEDN